MEPVDPEESIDTVTDQAAAPAPTVDGEEADSDLEAALASIEVDVVADRPRQRRPRLATGTTPPRAILWPHGDDDVD